MNKSNFNKLKDLILIYMSLNKNITNLLFSNRTTPYIDIKINAFTYLIESNFSNKTKYNTERYITFNINGKEFYSSLPFIDLSLIKLEDENIIELINLLEKEILKNEQS